MLESEFKVIYKQNFNKVRFYAHYYLNNWHEAENIAQETFVVLWNNRNRFKNKDEIFPYTMVVSRNLCINVLRKRNCMSKYRQNHMHNNDSIALGALYDYTSSAVYMKEMGKILDKALMDMPDKVKKTFILCRMEGMKYEEIATVENISVKTVEYRISTALKILRKYFKDYLCCFIILMSLLLWIKI